MNLKNNFFKYNAHNNKTKISICAFEWRTLHLLIDYEIMTFFLLVNKNYT